jgi:hypothetical protein
MSLTKRQSQQEVMVANTKKKMEGMNKKIVKQIKEERKSDGERGGGAKVGSKM